MPILDPLRQDEGPETSSAAPPPGGVARGRRDDLYVESRSVHGICVCTPIGEVAGE